MSLTTLENKIKTEWNFARAWVATHQIASLAIVAVVAWAAGRFL